MKNKSITFRCVGSTTPLWISILQMIGFLGPILIIAGLIVTIIYRIIKKRKVWDWKILIWLALAIVLFLILPAISTFAPAPKTATC